MRFAACLGFAIGLSGCATLMAGGPDLIPVNSNPPGAQVFVDGQLVGQTPMVVTLDREHSQGVIQIQTPGFAPAIVRRDKEINGWFWGNFCVGLWPFIVDLITGDYHRFDDTPIAVGMTPATGGYPPPMGPAPYPQQPGYPPAQGYPPAPAPAPGGYPPPPPPPPAR